MTLQACRPWVLLGARLTGHSPLSGEMWLSADAALWFLDRLNMMLVLHSAPKPFSGPSSTSCSFCHPELGEGRCLTQGKVDFWTFLPASPSRDIYCRKGSENELLIQVQRERRRGNHVGMAF